MNDMVEKLKHLVSEDVFLYIMIGIVVMIVITIIMMVMRSRKAKRQLEELEQRYHALKGIPLAFKVNKAVALSRVNPAMAERVDACKNDFDEVQEQLKQCSIALAESDDYIYVRKIKTASKRMEELAGLLDACEGNVNRVNELLDSVLEQENAQREQINILKDEFRELKMIIAENRGVFHQSIEYMENEVVSIEKMFSLFEEWMFASEFTKAGEQQDEIAKSIRHLTELKNQLPKLYEIAKGVLPRAVDEVNYNYAQAKNQGVYLDHLEVKKNLEIVTDMLKDDLNALRCGNIESVDEHLNESQRRLVQIQEQISKEANAMRQVEMDKQVLFDEIRELNQDMETIDTLYERVSTRFGFENWSKQLKDCKEKLADMNGTRLKLEEVLADNGIPYTTIILSIQELASTAHAFNGEIKSLKSKLENACSDEERAKKQLIKMQLIINEIAVKMTRHRLPVIDAQFDQDLAKAKRMMNEVRCILESTPLDVKNLNLQLRQTIDFVYTLYNSVNKLVGMANMVENAIVFGNKYRSTYPEIDSELTRAELCFRNGEYTKALKISIQAIERIHPGAYEKIVNKQEESPVVMEE